MSATDTEFPSFLSEKSGDVLVKRDGELYIVRGTKRFQTFVPRPLLDNLDPWMVLMAIVFSVFRVVPSWFTQEYQCGVILIEPKNKARVLTKQKVASSEDADRVKTDLRAQVESGVFDNA